MSESDVRILNKWQKAEKFLFPLLGNPTLNANFKWQPLKAALILIWIWNFNGFKDVLSNSFNYSWFDAGFGLSKLF